MFFLNTSYNREYRARARYREGLFQKLDSGKRAAFSLHIPTSRGGRSASPPEFSASRFSRKFSDLGTPIVLTEPPSKAVIGQYLQKHICGTPASLFQVGPRGVLQIFLADIFKPLLDPGGRFGM